MSVQRGSPEILLDQIELQSRTKVKNKQHGVLCKQAVMHSCCCADVLLTIFLSVCNLGVRPSQLAPRLMHCAACVHRLHCLQSSERLVHGLLTAGYIKLL